jgi:phosphocarrier protein HPr
VANAALLARCYGSASQSVDERGFEAHMRETTLVVEHEVGLHARPAAVFVQTAKKFKSDILVRKDEREVNAKSILSILTLGANQGAVITIKATGEDEEVALKALRELVENNFGESPHTHPASPPQTKGC